MNSRMFFAVALSSTIMFGCGGDGSQSTTRTGQFIDDPVSGLTYSCTNGTQTKTGTTGPQGEFDYIIGQTCTFSVGKVTLGTLSNIPSDGKVTPQDVAGVTRSATSAPSAVAIAQFLQTLNDGSTSGKIVIPAATSSAFNANTVASVTLTSSTGTISQSDLSSLVTAVLPTKTLVDASSVTSNLDIQLTQNNISLSTGAISSNTPRVLNSISVTTNANGLAAGLPITLTANGYYSDGTREDLSSNVTWSSSDSSALTLISAVATGKKVGNATVTASYTPPGSNNAITGSTLISTSAPTVVSIAVTSSNSLPAGLTDQLTAIATLTDGTKSDVTTSVLWTSSDITRATVGSRSGLVTGLTKGTSVITASYGSGTPITTTLSESVLDPNIVNLVISYLQSGLTSVQKTATATLKAVLNFTDSTYQTVSSAVNWLSSPSNLVSFAKDAVNNVATLTGLTEGSGTLSATYTDAKNTVYTSNSLSITVTPLISISGQAASGIAMDGATITATCQGGGSTQYTGTADASGNYTLILPAGVTSPCLLSATSTDSTGKSTTFYSAVPADVGTSTPTANITPLTHLVLTNATGVEPSPSTSLTTVATSLTTSAINSAATVVQTSLSSALGLPASSLSNPISTTFSVARSDSGVPPSQQDGALDQLMSSLNMANTSISTLASQFNNGANATTVTSNLKTLATTQGIPTSASTGCPFAVSGTFANVNIGSSNRNASGAPSFGFLKIDFSANPPTATNGSGATFTITPNSSNPCQFSVDAANKHINFQVSRSGFIVATSFDPPASDQNYKTMSAGTGADCFKPNSYCSGYQIGIPVQSNISLEDMAGTWQSVEWNLDQYQTNTGTSTSLNCPGMKDALGICSTYVSYARQFKVTNAGNLKMYSCDGLGQSGQACSSAQMGTDLTLSMCDKSSQAIQSQSPTACPSVTLSSGNTIVLSSTVNAVDSSGSVVSRTLAFRAPNNDLIGFFIAGQGGPTNTDSGHTYSFSDNVNNINIDFKSWEFQEQFGVIFRPAKPADLPIVNSTINNPQWIAVDWGSAITSATFSSGTQLSATYSTSTNPLVKGQIFYGGGSYNNGRAYANYFLPSTNISDVSCTGSVCSVTLSCGQGVTECRSTQTGLSKFPNGVTVSGSNGSSIFGAFGFQIKELTQKYTVTALDEQTKTVTRSFINLDDNGHQDTPVLDMPHRGLSYRPYVRNAFNESVSLRGAGFAVSMGTATIAQQRGYSGDATHNYAKLCMPGQTLSNGSCTGDRTTGKFFTLNLKY